MCCVHHAPAGRVQSRHLHEAQGRDVEHSEDVEEHPVFIQDVRRATLIADRSSSRTERTRDHKLGIIASP